MSDDISSQSDEARKRSEETVKQSSESSEKYHKEHEKSVKRDLQFVIITFFYSYIFTIYFFAIFKMINIFRSPNTYGDFFVGELGTQLLILLIISYLAIGLIFYKLKGLVFAIVVCIVSPVAAFLFTFAMWGLLEQWYRRKRFERLSPEEQEREYQASLSLDYKYSSRGP